MKNKKKIKIALDAMGSDLGPSSVIEGAYLAKKKYPNIEYLIFGDKKKVFPLLEKRNISINSTFVETSQIITNNIKPIDALRKYKDSSMFKSINSVKCLESDAVVSGGNTGALMVISSVLMKTIKGISRPAIASMFPTKKFKTVMLDLGANIECNEKNITDFAIMGNVFCKTVLGIKKPKIGLLNVGSEILKGSNIIRLSAKNLSLKRNINFCGFVEGNDIPNGVVDVVVTDGFTGNIALKIAEGTAELYTEYLKNSFNRNFYSKFAFFISSPILNFLKKKVNPSKYNGAMFLGLNGIVVKSHGRSDANGFANAISVAYDLCKNNFNEKIVYDIKRIINKK